MNQVLSYTWTIVLLVSQGISALVMGQSALGLQNSSSLFSNDGVRPYTESQFFQEQFLRDSTYAFSLVNDGSSTIEPAWEIYERSIYKYNNRGQVTVQIQSSKQNELWTPSVLYTFNYNDRNELVNTLKSVWNAPLQKWEQREKNQFFYNLFGAEYETRKCQWLNNNWAPVSRELKAYDTAQNLTTEVIYKWNTDENDWNPAVRMLYAYDEHALVATETIQLWNAEIADWENQSSSDFIYDDDNQLIETVASIWDTGLEAFTPEVVTMLDYNDLGMPSLSESVSLSESGQQGLNSQNAEYSDEGVLNTLYTQRWDVSTSTWEPYRYEEHYWSRYLTGNINATTGDIACQFVNPYEMGMPWYCNSLKENLQYDVLVYDLLGRLYFQTQFQGGHTFNIRGAIPPGLYMVVIQGGLDMHTEKVLFR